MKCDRCREQLPVGDGIDHRGQTLCLVCYLQGAASSQPFAALHCLDLVGADGQKVVPMSIIDAEFAITQFN